MSKEKKGFIVYDDNYEVIKRLSDEEAGRLLKGMLEYSISGKDPKFKGVLEFVFIPIQQQMDRNAEKYAARCEKNRENVKLRWERSKNTNEYERIRNNTNHTDTDKDTDTDTKTNTDTDTTTDTKAAEPRGGGRYKVEDEFNIWKKLTPEDIDVLYEKFPNSGGLLIDEVFAEVKAKKTKVRSGLNYILGYAKKVGWDDNADHFDGGGMA